MDKEEFRKMEREYSIWLHNHPKGKLNYKAFSHMSRTLEFAKYWGMKTSCKLGKNLHNDYINQLGYCISCSGEDIIY